jgi:hypothetical protein
MRTSNLANEAIRQAESGHVWEEVLSGAQGTLVLKPFQTFRVRAAGATTVTIDGTLAMTMVSGEIAIFNAGSGVPQDVDNSTGVVVRQANQATVVIAGANAFVQVARTNVRSL